MSDFNYVIVDDKTDERTVDGDAPAGFGYEIQEPSNVEQVDPEGFAVGEGQPNPDWTQRTEARKPSFWDQFVQGLGFSGDETVKEKVDKLVLEDSFVGRAGAILAEKAVGEDSELVQNARISEKYREWQPRIWQQQEKLAAVGDSTTPEYQEEWQKLQDLRRNFRDDLNGEYIPPEVTDDETFDWGQFWDAVSENKGLMTGALARGILADPELLLLPGGWTKTGAQALKIAKAAGMTSKAALTTSKMAGQVTGAATLAAGFGAGGEVIAQIDDDPDADIDFDKVANMALISGGIAAPLPLVGNIVTGTANKVKNVFSNRAVRGIQANANKKYAEAIDEDGVARLNKNAAVEQAVAEANLSPEAEAAFRETVPNVDDFIQEDLARAMLAEQALTQTVAGQIGEGFGNFARGVQDGWNKMTQPLTSRLRNMGLPHIAGKLNRLDMETATELGRKHQVALLLSDQYRRLSPELKTLFKMHANNGTFDTVASQYPDDFRKAFASVRTMLDDELTAAQNAGLDIPGEQNYFPRKFNYEKFAKEMGVKVSKTDEAMAQAINEKWNLAGENKLSAKDVREYPELITKNLNETEQAEAIARLVERGGAPRTAGIPSPSPLRARTVDDIPPEMQAFYDDPIVALNDHINKMTVRIKDREFFGGKMINRQRDIMQGDNPQPNDETMIRGFIDDAINLELADRNITPEMRDELFDILHARFVGAKQKPNVVVSGLRNALYTATLGNPVAAATQLGDVGASAYLNGVDTAMTDLITRSVRGANNLRRGQGKAPFKLEDFGLQSLPDPDTIGATAKILDWSLRLGGFKAMDRLGKEAIMNSTWRKLQSIGRMSDDKAMKLIRERYGQRLGDGELAAILDGIRSGDTTNPHVRLAVFSDLTRVQPVSMSEMPAAYLNNPNMRIFYMLKTFTLKQIDLMRQEVIKNIDDGVRAGSKKQVADGVMNMGKLLFTIGAANMGVDATKRWIQGEDVELGDTIVSNILRNYGLSQYTLNELAKGEPETFAAKVVAPPLGVFTMPFLEGANRLTGGAWGMDTNGRWIDAFPYGRFVRFVGEAIEGPDPRERRRARRERVRRQVER